MFVVAPGDVSDEVCDALGCLGRYCGGLPVLKALEKSVWIAQWPVNQLRVHRDSFSSFGHRHAELVSILKHFPPFLFPLTCNPYSFREKIKQ